jgi:hypothetical protein
MTVACGSLGKTMEEAREKIMKSEAESPQASKRKKKEGRRKQALHNKEVSPHDLDPRSFPNHHEGSWMRE